MKLKNSFFTTAIGTSGSAKVGYMNTTHQKLYADKINELIGESPSGVRRGLFYVGGAMEHHSLGRKFPVEPIQSSSVLIKSQSSVAAWSWAKRIPDISFVTINANTCASSMYSIFEAWQAIHSGALDEAIVIAEEWTEPLELLMFKQMGIDIVCGEGFCMLHFASLCDQPLAEIESVCFRWLAESSPFGVSEEGYRSVMSLVVDEGEMIDGVKMHASGTSANDIVETTAVTQMFPSAKTLEYKSRIGHTQGISSALELAMMVGDGIEGKWLINAAGLGGFYGCAKVKI